ncbi:MAG: hypothetical protein VKL59_12315 [Nostocaceae cyanobacterium]|nr:hypothetical protein [Nostocaceae cyanobacterium]
MTPNFSLKFVLGFILQTPLATTGETPTPVAYGGKPGVQRWREQRSGSPTYAYRN